PQPDRHRPLLARHLQSEEVRVPGVDPIGRRAQADGRVVRVMISLCVPSRGRPGRFATMLRSAKATAAGEFEVCVWLDDDDPSKYPEDRMVRYGSGPRPYIDGVLCTSGLWSKAWDLATGD